MHGRYAATVSFKARCPFLVTATSACRRRIAVAVRALSRDGPALLEVSVMVHVVPTTVAKPS